MKFSAHVSSSPLPAAGPILRICTAADPVVIRHRPSLPLARPVSRMLRLTGLCVILPALRTLLLVIITVTMRVLRRRIRRHIAVIHHVARRLLVLVRVRRLRMLRWRRANTPMALPSIAAVVPLPLSLSLPIDARVVTIITTVIAVRASTHIRCL